jgi:hypothetical protein
VSLAVFPRFLGQGFTISKEDRFSTIVNESTSGKETAVILWTQPRWDFELSYDFVRQRQDYGNQIGMVPVTAALLSSLGDYISDDFKGLVGFHAAAYGRGLTWLYDDPTDNWINGQQIGIGNGSTTQFQVARQIGGFSEFIQNINGTPVNASPRTTSLSLNALIIPTNVAIDTQGGRLATPWQTPGWPNYFKVTTAGTGGVTEPNYRVLAPFPGQTLQDGTALLTNMGTPFVLFVNGTPQATSSYSLSSTGLVTFNSAPANTAVITVTCGFYFQCRFQEDKLTLSELVNTFWQGRSVKFSSVKV